MLDMFGGSFAIYSNAPEFVETCLKANYPSRYRPADTNIRADYSLTITHGDSNTPESERPAIEGTGGVFTCTAPPTGAPETLRFVFEAVAAFVQTALKNRKIFFVHAASVVWKRKAMLVAGANECGKSTIARALISNGATFLADDAAPILAVQNSAATAIPSPEAVTVKDLAPEEIEMLAAVGFTRGPDPRFMAPPEGAEEAPVKFLFFPERSESVLPIMSLTKKEALLKILKLNKTPLTDVEFSSWFQAAYDLANNSTAARVSISTDSAPPVSEIFEFCENV